MLETTDTRVKVKAVPGEEYSNDGGKTWVKPQEGADSVTFSGLNPASHQEIVSRKAGTDSLNPSLPSAPAITTTKKAEQTAPAKPSGTAATDDAANTSSITVSQPDSAQEYLVVKKGQTVTEDDWDNAKRSVNGGAVSFGGLTPGEEFEIVARNAEDATHYASGPVRSDPITTPKAQQSAPAKPGSDAVTATTDDMTGTSSITVEPTVKGNEYMVVPKGKSPLTEDDWKNAKTSQDGEALVFDGLTPGEDYEVVTRVPGDETHDPSPATRSDPVTTPARADEDANAKSDKLTGKSRITVDPTTAGHEYVVVPKGTKLEDVDWSTAKRSRNGEAIVFTGLEPGKEYTVMSREPGDATHEPSEPTTLNVRTPAPFQLPDEYLPLYSFTFPLKYFMVSTTSPERSPYAHIPS